MQLMNAGHCYYSVSDMTFYTITEQKLDQHWQQRMSYKGSMHTSRKSRLCSLIVYLFKAERWKLQKYIPRLVYHAPRLHFKFYVLGLWLKAVFQSATQKSTKKSQCCFGHNHKRRDCVHNEICMPSVFFYMVKSLF